MHDGLRAQLGQLSWSAREYGDPRRWGRLARAARRVDLPPLPRRGRREGEVWAVSTVRDERDVVGAVVQHLLDQGVDHVLVADNRSTDGTYELLSEMADSDPRVHVARDHEPVHIQSEKNTRLAHRAWAAGADWVVPFDGDEFWFARGRGLADHLRQETNDVVFGDFLHMVTVEPATDARDATYLLDSTRAFPSKVAFRTHPLAVVGHGNHEVARVGGRGRGLYVAHAIYRSQEQVTRKFRQGLTAAAKAPAPVLGEHWRAGASLDDAVIDDVWRTITAGLPDPRIRWAAAGPMVRVRPGRWPTWDPEGLLG
jgi:hypothetical protein